MFIHKTKNVKLSKEILCNEDIEYIAVGMWEQFKQVMKNPRVNCQYLHQNSEISSWLLSMNKEK